MTFNQATAEELASKIPSGKPVTLNAVGSPNDWAVAEQYLAFLQHHGFNVEYGMRAGMVSPPPDHKISIFDAGAKVIVTIAPSAN